MARLFFNLQFSNLKLLKNFKNCTLLFTLLVLFSLSSCQKELVQDNTIDNEDILTTNRDRDTEHLHLVEEIQQKYITKIDSRGIESNVVSLFGFTLWDETIVSIDSITNDFFTITPFTKNGNITTGYLIANSENKNVTWQFFHKEVMEFEYEHSENTNIELLSHHRSIPNYLKVLDMFNCSISSTRDYSDIQYVDFSEVHDLSEFSELTVYVHADDRNDSTETSTRNGGDDKKHFGDWCEAYGCTCGGNGEYKEKKKMYILLGSGGNWGWNDNENWDWEDWIWNWTGNTSGDNNTNGTGSTENDNTNDGWNSSDDDAVDNIGDDNYNLTEEQILRIRVLRYIDENNLPPSNFLRYMDLAQVDWIYGDNFDELLAVAIFLDENPLINSMFDNYEANNPDSEYAEQHKLDQVMLMIADPEYKDFVESSAAWGGVFGTIVLEIAGDAAIDALGKLIGGGVPNNIKEAIKGVKNGDWISVTGEIGQIIWNNTPIGKLLKIGEVGSDFYHIGLKINKIWDKVEVFAENVLEQMWSIVSKYGSEIRLNSDLIESICKAIQRGLKSIDDVMESVLPFAEMTTDRLRHILHGDATGGLHHASGLINDPSRVVSHYFPKDSKGVYRIIHNGKNSTMFPDDWDELYTANAIKQVFGNNPVVEIASGKPQINGFFEGVEIRIDLFTDGTIKTAYPIYKP